MSAARLDIAANKRVPWVGTFVFVGPDWTEAAFLMHVRQHWGDTGLPLLVPGFSATFDPAYSYYNPRTRQTIIAPATIVTAVADEASIEALPFNGEEEKPLELVYDIHVTPVAEVKVVALAGNFSVYPGSTI